MSPLSPRRKRQVTGVLAGIVVFSAVAGANLAAAAERTVVDADYTIDQLEDRGFYEAFAGEMRAQMQSGENGTAETSGESGTAEIGFENTSAPPVDDVIESVVTEEYAREQVERNVYALYGYLHGEREDLALAVDVTPVEDGFVSEYRAWVLEAEVAELEQGDATGDVEYRMADLAESEPSFQRTRTSFRQDQLERAQERTPREHTREELEEIYDDNREMVRDELVAELERRVRSGDAPPAVQPAIVDYGTVGVDALVARETSYDRFVEEEGQAREDLAEAVGDVVRRNVDEELPDTMNVSAGPGGNPEQSFGPLRTWVSLTGPLALALPVVALIAALVLGYVSRRRSDALLRVGGSVAGAGVTCFAIATVLPGVLADGPSAGGGDPDPMAEAMVGVLTDALGVVGTQSLAVVAIGAVIAGVGIAVRRGVGPLEDGSVDHESPVDGETSGDVESPVDGETSGDVESPVDGETSGDVESPVDGETSGDVESPVDEETSGDVASPVDEETSGDVASSADDNPAADEESPDADGG